MIKLTIKSIVAAVTMLAAGASVSTPTLADELDTIKEKGSITIAMSGAYPPFNFVDEENKVVGFDPAIGAEIAKRMGVEVKIVTTAWDGIIAGLLANKYDAIVGSMSITEKREKVVDFVGPYYRMNRAVFVRQGSDLSGLGSLSGKKVGATLGETHEKWARSQDGWKLKTYKGLPELILELENGRIDAFVTDDIPVLVAIRENGAKIAKMDAPDLTGTADQAGIAIRKGNPKLAAAMQEALDAMQADGTYTAIAEKWVGADIR
ncbi:transporter substrate-binding domain-containing protein [Rhodobacteraceae bacterium RKSG542]|uniref:transporter substrate-binding domain-containing protein n=1 Tax=Pseudovibrio flavus TaxID=2529854 RepID=UPI0012BBCB68|nr:transporter substrate-binding domain-containing protein [Pseudovibrio flavus]MTI16441.1 transporter substrate-binding domain-containing protein [Pseudovibrio flavus]